MKKLFFASLFLLLAQAAFSQSAEKINEIIRMEHLTFGKAAYLSECAIDEGHTDTITETTAFEKLQVFGAIRNGRTENEEISMQEFCHIMAKTWRVSGSLFLLLFKSPRYSFKQMKADGVVPKTADPNEKVSGRVAMYIISNCIDTYEK